MKHQWSVNKEKLVRLEEGSCKDVNEENGTSIREEPQSSDTCNRLIQCIKLILYLELAIFIGCAGYWLWQPYGFKTVEMTTPKSEQSSDKLVAVPSESTSPYDNYLREKFNRLLRGENPDSVELPSVDNRLSSSDNGNDDDVDEDDRVISSIDTTTQIPHLEVTEASEKRASIVETGNDDDEELITERFESWTSSAVTDDDENYRKKNEDTSAPSSNGIESRNGNSHEDFLEWNFPFLWSTHDVKLSKADPVDDLTKTLGLEELPQSSEKLMDETQAVPSEDDSEKFELSSDLSANSENDEFSSFHVPRQQVFYPYFGRTWMDSTETAGEVENVDDSLSQSSEDLYRPRYSEESEVIPRSREFWWEDTSLKNGDTKEDLEDTSVDSFKIQNDIFDRIRRLNELVEALSSQKIREHTINLSVEHELSAPSEEELKFLGYNNTEDLEESILREFWKKASTQQDGEAKSPVLEWLLIGRNVSEERTSGESAGSDNGNSWVIWPHYSSDKKELTMSSDSSASDTDVTQNPPLPKTSDQLDPFELIPQMPIDQPWFTWPVHSREQVESTDTSDPMNIESKPTESREKDPAIGCNPDTLMCTTMNDNFNDNERTAEVTETEVNHPTESVDDNNDYYDSDYRYEYQDMPSPDWPTSENSREQNVQEETSTKSFAESEQSDASDMTVPLFETPNTSDTKEDTQEEFSSLATEETENESVTSEIPTIQSTQHPSTSLEASVSDVSPDMSIGVDYNSQENDNSDYAETASYEDDWRIPTYRMALRCRYNSMFTQPRIVPHYQHFLHLCQHPYLRGRRSIPDTQNDEGETTNSQEKGNDKTILLRELVYIETVLLLKEIESLGNSARQILERNLQKFVQNMENISSHIDFLEERYLHLKKLDDDYISQELPADLHENRSA